MANSANPEINKKIATSALGTLVIATVFFYLGDRYAETLVTYPGQIFDHLSDAFLSMWQTIKDAPFALDMTSNSLLFGGACFLIIWMIWLRYVAFIGNYRSGEESGSARWGTLKEGKKFKDLQTEDNNLLFTKNFGLALHRPKFDPEYDRNLNVLVVGGSGSGKTFNYVTPNICQLNTSYFVTDPKGTLLKDAGYLFTDNGYKLKSFNTINLDESMHYNPLKYVKTDTDILSFVNCFIMNTNPEGKSSGDPFWENAEKMLYTALIALLRDWFPAKDYNMSSLLTLLSLAEARENDENFKSALDLMFLQIEEGKVYTAICERYAVQFLPPAVYDVSESTVSVDGGTLKLTAKRLSDAGFTAVFPNISNSHVREDSDTGNPWVPAGSHTLAGISCSITEGETTPPAPYTEGTLITDMASIAKYVKDPEIREILKRKDDGKKGEHGGIGTTATRSSIIEGLKTRGYLEERKGKVRATDKAKAFYALLPPEIRGADVTARWWLIQQDIADGKADVNALQDSVIEVFNHHRETAYVGASIAGAGKTVVGKCPRCGKDVIKTGSIYACSSIKNEKQEDGTWKEVAGCGFKLFGFCTKKFTEKQAASLLDGKAVSLRGCKSKAGKTFDCTVVLQKDGSVEPIFTPRKPTKKGRR